ncbi:MULTISPECIES: hypothetical protein [Morganellaceae]|nr:MULTISPECIES: hypothetical protein [Morganellaceae]WIF72227.1 hypothetical protein QN092_20165 [Proteus vulgaris]
MNKQTDEPSDKSSDKEKSPQEKDSGSFLPKSILESIRRRHKKPKKPTE